MSNFQGAAKNISYKRRLPRRRLSQDHERGARGRGNADADADAGAEADADADLKPTDWIIASGELPQEVLRKKNRQSKGVRNTIYKLIQQNNSVSANF